MTTRLWLTGTATPFTPTGVNGTWNTFAGADIQYLGRKPSGSAGTSSINAGTTSNTSVMVNRFISDGLVTAGTSGGTVSWVFGAKESNVDANAFTKVHIWATVGSTSVSRGVLLSNSIGGTELTTTATGTADGAKTISPVALSVGDRIVVEVGYNATPLVSTYNATINYGNVGTTDLTAGVTTVTTFPGWIEFTGMDGLFTKSFTTLTDTFPTTIDAKWVASAGVAVSGGRARINCTTANPSMYTATPYEIQASQVAVQVPTLPAVGGASIVDFAMYIMAGPTPGTTNLQIEYSPVSGNILFRNNVGGSDASPTTVVYNATSHAYWRIRESAGSILMETSPNNSTWTTQRTISTMSQWMLQGNLIATFDSSRNGGTADFGEIDNINVASGSSATKVWNGSAFVVKPVKVWNGSAWVAKPLKTWNGSAWI